MFDLDDFIPCVLIFLWGLVIGVCVGDLIGDPTELPNGCILYEDVIYCEEVTE